MARILLIVGVVLIAFFSLGWIFNRQAFPKDNPFNPFLHAPWGSIPLKAIFITLFSPTQPRWVLVGNITKDDPQHNWHDPSVIKLPDGRYRMFMQTPRDLTNADTPVSFSDAVIRSAISSDGKTFSLEDGMRIQGGQNATPDVIQIGPTKWRMYFQGRSSGQESSYIKSAISNDTLSWTVEPGVRLPSGGEFDKDGVGHPDVIQLPDGGWKMYYDGVLYHQPNGIPPNGWIGQILSASSKDGLNWTKDPGVRIRAFEPKYNATFMGNSRTIYENGVYQMYFSNTFAAVSARSTDGVNFTIDDRPVLSPGFVLLLSMLTKGVMGAEVYQDVFAMQDTGEKRMYFSINGRGLYFAHSF